MTQGPEKITPYTWWVKKEAMVEVVREWEAQGKVEWSSPAFLVPKKNGKWRGVVDFRALNEATVGDSHPLPRIEDILVRQGGRSMYTIMDLKDAFHKYPAPLSRPLTCTSTPIGTKQWCVVVMGLKNGVPIFQRVVEWCLRGVDDIASPYVDDILSGTEAQATKLDTLIAHEKDIRKVLEEMKATKLVADIKKCDFFVEEVEFCGHILVHGRRKPAPGKLLAIAKWEEPRTITALRGFLGVHQLLFVIRGGICTPGPTVTGFSEGGSKGG